MKGSINLLFGLGILVGIIFPMQTAINSKLRSRVGSPYLAAMVAFVVSSIFLGCLTLLQGNSILVDPRLFATQPDWIWLGGVFGIVGGTIPIILFPHLGSVQTVVIPIVGQIIMSMLIDNFGWFSAPVFKFTPFRLLGIILLLIGLFSVVFVRSTGRGSNRSRIVWQLLGLLAGAALAAQAAVNGRLGTVLRSPVHAAFISFLTGMVILVLGVGIFERDFGRLKRAVGHGNPWWIWFGGLLGGSYVFGNSFLAPLIGTGATVVITLFGNIAGGLVIDQWGLLGAARRKIRPRQYLGLALMIAGVILVKCFN